MCRSLEYTELLELQIIKEYTLLLGGCNYPEVRVILSEMIGDHERTLAMLHEKKLQLSEQFSILGLINDSFEEDTLSQ